MSDRPGADGVDPTTVTSTPPRPRSSGSIAVGRAMMAVGDIIEGKPPRDAYEYTVESDQPDEPEDPWHLIIEL